MIPLVLGALGAYAAFEGGNVTDGTIADVWGMGDNAWVAVGKTGDQLINVAVTQGNGVPASKVNEITIALMTMVAAKA